MLSLLNAIFSSFTSNSTLTAALPGGLHRDQAAEGPALPYVVSTVLQSTIEYGYHGACRSDVSIRFNVFGVGHDASGTLAQTLVSQFDDQLLSLTDGAVNDSVTRLTDPIPKLHRHDASGNDVWEWSVTYEYGVVL